MDIEIATENELSESVLMIAMTNSIHTARWINQFRGVSMQITLIPSTGTSNVHPMIKDLLNSEGPLKLKVPENFRRNAYSFTGSTLRIRTNFNSHWGDGTCQ